MRRGSIRTRLLRAVMLWAALWCTALGAAVWLAVREEVDELLDDTLKSAAEGLVGSVVRDAGDLGVMTAAVTPVDASRDASAAAADPAASNASPTTTPVAAAPTATTPTATTPAATTPTATTPTAAEPPDNGPPRFAWQLVAHGSGARLVAASRGAPAQLLHATPAAGFSRVPGWRVYGQPVGHDGRMLYVAQTRNERWEAQAQIGLAVVLAGVPMALLALLWLNARVRHELEPLRVLSLRLEHHDPLRPGATLGPAEDDELRPVRSAIDALAARLARRIAHERAFTAHAAHALRTPLAGIDAQLAVAVREAPGPLQPRLQRVRSAAGRLQHVVAALLALFRSGAEVQRQPLDVGALVARMPVDGLVLEAQASLPVSADADLITAALLNLLDNAHRHGAQRVLLDTPAPDTLRIRDDGRGVADEQRRTLQAALDTQAYEGRTGLGLMLADLVARAHGGRLELPAAAAGFVAVLHLGAR